MRRKTDIRKTVNDKWNGTPYTGPFRKAGLYPVTFYFHLICGVAQKRGCVERRHGRSTDHHYSRDASFVLQYRERLSLVAFPVAPLWMESYCLSRGQNTLASRLLLLLWALFCLTFAIVRISDEGLHSSRPFHSRTFRCGVCDRRFLKIDKLDDVEVCGAAVTTGLRSLKSAGCLL